MLQHKPGPVAKLSSFIRPPTRQALESPWLGQDQRVVLEPERLGYSGSSLSKMDRWRQIAKAREKQVSTERVLPYPISHKTVQHSRSWGSRECGGESHTSQDEKWRPGGDLCRLCSCMPECTSKQFYSNTLFLTPLSFYKAEMAQASQA